MLTANWIAAWGIDNEGKKEVDGWFDISTALVLGEVELVAIVNSPDRNINFFQAGVDPLGTAGSMSGYPRT